MLFITTFRSGGSSLCRDFSIDGSWAVCFLRQECYDHLFFFFFILWSRLFPFLSFHTVRDHAQPPDRQTTMVVYALHILRLLVDGAPGDHPCIPIKRDKIVYRKRKKRKEKIEPQRIGIRIRRKNRTCCCCFSRFSFFSFPESSYLLI